MVLLTLTICGCTAEALRAPSLDENKLYATCTDELFETFQIMESQLESMPTAVRQKAISLLFAAEIDGQFKHYPECVDKLERARLFLQQAKLDLSIPSPKPPVPSP